MNFIDPKELDIPNHGTKNRYRTILPSESPSHTHTHSNNSSSSENSVYSYCSDSPD